MAHSCQSFPNLQQSSGVQQSCSGYYGYLAVQIHPNIVSRLPSCDQFQSQIRSQEDLKYTGKGRGRQSQWQLDPIVNNKVRVSEILLIWLNRLEPKSVKWPPSRVELSCLSLLWHKKMASKSEQTMNENLNALKLHFWSSGELRDSLRVYRILLSFLPPHLFLSLLPHLCCN